MDHASRRTTPFPTKLRIDLHSFGLRLKHDKTADQNATRYVCVKEGKCTLCGADHRKAEKGQSGLAFATTADQ